MKPVSCCPELGESTRIKADEYVMSNSTKLKRWAIDHEIQGLNPVSCCPELRESARIKYDEKMASDSSTMVVLLTIDHEMYGSNPVSCCPELGEVPD